MRPRLFCKSMKAMPLLLVSFAAGVVTAKAQISPAAKPDDPYNANNRRPDDRYKADVLVVVAHPDDEIMAAAYIARLIDEKKRVALVFTTLGDGGINSYGPEQSAAMGEIRYLEGVHAGESLGISNIWNLMGPDTPSQNVLESLETCSHGRCLDRLVRLVRITRPSVILTWLPVFVTGENHSDHQAAGVLATEAFDLAGDPTAFPEQVSPARDPNKNMNSTEGLRPWQPEKLYYFSNAMHTDFFNSNGPQYPSTDISPTRHVTYGEIAAREFMNHLTQGGGRMERAINKHDLKALEYPIPLMEPVRLILGKSLVKSGAEEDVFAGVVPDGIAYQRPPGASMAKSTEFSMELGDPWSYYRQFWEAHGLHLLFGLVPPEVTVQAGTTLYIPIAINNPTNVAADAEISVQAPEGWKVAPIANAHIDPHSRHYIRVQAAVPAEKREDWQQFEVSAKSGTKKIGSISIRVQIAGWALPQ
jgi:LmbE family N-acetylglucosaminyl deacetylase